LGKKRRTKIDQKKKKECNGKEKEKTKERQRKEKQKAIEERQIICTSSPVH
jgi:hypothetical protein